MFLRKQLSYFRFTYIFSLTIFIFLYGCLDEPAQTQESDIAIIGSKQIGNDLWLVGTQGFSAKSTDGRQFEVVRLASNGNYYDISGSNDTIYRCGKAGRLDRSIDGGVRWLSQNTGTTKSIRSIHFFDGRNGIACGESGLLISTSNAGETWEDKSIEGNFSFTRMKFLNSNFGVMTTRSNVNTNSRIFITTNGGTDWEVKLLDTNRYLNGIVLKSEKEFIIGGVNKIYSTNDGGNTFIEEVDFSTYDTLFIKFPITIESITEDDNNFIVAGNIGFNNGGIWTVNKQNYQLNFVFNTGVPMHFYSIINYNNSIIGNGGYGYKLATALVNNYSNWNINTLSK